MAFLSDLLRVGKHTLWQGLPRLSRLALAVPGWRRTAQSRAECAWSADARGQYRL